MAIRILLGHKVVLGKPTGFSPQRRLNFLRVEAAVGQPTFGVVAALASADVEVAANVVQAIAWIVGAAHDFDVIDLKRKDHVDEALVAAIDVTRDTVDQNLDSVDVALTVESPEGGLARFGPHAGFGQLNPGHLAE